MGKGSRHSGGDTSKERRDHLSVESRTNVVGSGFCALMQTRLNSINGNMEAQAVAKDMLHWAGAGWMAFLGVKLGTKAIILLTPLVKGL